MLTPKYIPYSCNARIHAVGMIDYLSNGTGASLCILQYEHMSRGRGCSASVVFKFLTVLKWCTLPMLNKKELETL